MSRRRYVLSIAARASIDIAQAKAWLTQPGSGRRGWRRYADLNRAVLDLATSPLRWPPSEQPGLRERSFVGYRVLYTVDEARLAVRVLRVFGPYQARPAR